MEWPDPWQPVTAPDAAGRLGDEIVRELSPGHPLVGVPVEAVARREDNDDVLVRLLDGSGRLAVVHLSWRGAAEPPPWPHTTFYADEEAWRSAAGGRDP